MSDTNSVRVNWLFSFVVCWSLISSKLKKEIIVSCWLHLALDYTRNELNCHAMQALGNDLVRLYRATKLSRKAEQLKFSLC